MDKEGKPKTQLGRSTPREESNADLLASWKERVALMNTKNHVLANMNDGKGNRWIVVKEFKRRIDKKKKKTEK